MWTPGRLAFACAGIVAMLATPGCTGWGVEPDVSPSAVSATTSSSPSPTDSDVTTPIAPSQAAGIPTVEPSPPAAQNPGTLDASVVLTLATVDPDTGGLLVGGYVSGLMEDGGDCEYVVTSVSGTSVSVHTEGVENNGSTSCGSTTLSPSLVPAGTYSVVLRYTNDLGHVASDPVEVDVP